MLKTLGRRGVAAVLGISLFGMLGGEAAAQQAPRFDIHAAVASLDTDTTARPLGNATAPTTVASVTSNVTAAVSNAIQTVSGSLMPAKTSIATEAAWLFQNGWPLYALVDKYATDAQLDEESTCLATAVYFEARGETLEGQLAVARVVMNRAASDRYPPSWCATVKQPWQFSFVNPHTGAMPRADKTSSAWRRAQAIAELAKANIVPSVTQDVLWYHADYVAPSWGRRLNRVEKIGAHIFYRA